MKKFNSCLFLSLVAVSFAVLPACKTKKIAQTTPPVSTPVAQTPPEEKPTPATPPKEEPVQEEKIDYSFKNIQFEFDSAVLKTFSYPILDQVASALKNHPDVKMELDGHSSEEGTTAHNMSLSIDRANAVKAYLVNAGVDAQNLTVRGFGETKPLASNADENGRALNRRVEFKKVD